MFKALEGETLEHPDWDEGIPTDLSELWTNFTALWMNRTIPIYLAHSKYIYRSLPSFGGSF